MRPAPGIEPAPPRVAGRLPWLGSGLALLRDPSAFFARARRELGDTFVVDAFGHRLFCVFSAEALRALYALPEREASFGLATFELVMRHKIPLELAVGRRNRPHDLFGSQEVEEYLGTLEEAVRCEIAELGGAGRFEIFARARRLGHRLGLACWTGEEAASARYLDRLIPLFERLDTSESFVHPASLFVSVATRKRRERRAMVGIEAVVTEILAGREGRTPPDDFLTRIHASFMDLPEPERAVQTARDVMLIHLGAQSNLPAALAWTLVDLLLRPALLERVAAGDDALLERCANESIRMAQRSITLRRVMRPIEIHDGERSYRVEPGAMVTTMLSVNNRSAAPSLEHFDPDHYEGRRLAKQLELPARELVSTFGHGRHSCPAQRFSISAIRIALRRLLDRYELIPEFSSATPRRRQLGGVARAERACVVSYRAR
jgi:cytochrome P450